MKIFTLYPKKKWTLLSILFFLSFTFYAESQTLTYKDIISKMYYLPALANLPEKGEKGALFSSYDRKSKYDEKSDTYVNWEANIDGTGIIRKEGKNLVLAEIKGPGVIWRIWSAYIGKGKVKIYLDGKLAIDLPWANYFNGKTAPFNRKGLVYKVSQGWNNYTPISFQRSCKIVATPTWGCYYHFNYTIFPKGTKVPTFKMKLSLKENKALDKANRILTTNLGKNPVPRKIIKEEVVNWTIPVGKSKALNITGKRAIISLKVRIPTNSNYNDLLRQLTLSINWDNEKSPSVWSPLGDFFGTAPGANEYKSLVMGMTKIGCQVSGVRGRRTEDGGQNSQPLIKGDTNHTTNPNKIFNIQHEISNVQVKSINPIIHQFKDPISYEFYSYWYMPFEKSAAITIKNESDKPQKISLIVEHALVKSSFENLGYFHAKWHRDLKTYKDRQIDWEILESKGKGRFVGCSLHVWNGKGGWWGEGDEKFFVDGEKFPSTIGTGTEDYFGYAYCNPALFIAPFHSQTINASDLWRGHIANNRWHISDNIPFQKSFDAYIEKYFENSRSTFYDCVAYWYHSKNGTDKIKITPLKDRLGYYINTKLYKEKNAIEGESLSIKTISKGITKSQDLFVPGNAWSDDAQLVWTGGGIGDFIEFEVDSPENTTTNFVAQFTRANDYAIIQLYLNGAKIGAEIDGHYPTVIAPGKIRFGKVKLKKGKNILKIKITGANPKAIKKYFVGIDYIKFE